MPTVIVSVIGVAALAVLRRSVVVKARREQAAAARIVRRSRRPIELVVRALELDDRIGA